MTAISPSILTSRRRQWKNTPFSPSSRWRGEHSEERKKKNKQNAPGNNALQLAAVRRTPRHVCRWDGELCGKIFFFFSPRLSSVASVFLWESLLPPCSVVPRLCVVRPVYFSTICFTWCGRRDNVASHATSAPDEGKYCLLPSFEQRAKRRELANLCVSTRRAAPCTASA